MSIEWIHPDELRNHPVNQALYGDVPDPELVESVKKHGVFEDHPIGYVQDGDFKVIVSGHRRRQSAKIAKRDMVPIVRLKSLEGDEQSIREHIILSNRHRLKDREMMAREAAMLIEIESERAKERKTQNLSGNSRQGKIALTGEPSGKAVEKVGEALGVSGRTATDLTIAGKALIEAEKAGDTQAADEIKANLKRGASTAARGVRERKANPKKGGSVVCDSIGRAIPESLKPHYATSVEIVSAGTKLDQLKKLVNELAEKQGGEFLEQSRIEEEIRALKTRITSSRYWSECPRCRGKVGVKCDRCDAAGFIPVSRKNQLSDEDKQYLGVEK